MGKEIYYVLQDPAYQDAYIDIDETRVRVYPDGREVAYRYMHGGFTQMKVKFSLHFPAKEQFKGRFFQYLSPFPGPDEEMVSLTKTGEDDVILFSLENGAYFVESNMGMAPGTMPGTDDLTRWKSSAAVAEFSRKKAMEIYGCERPVGIVYGGSGGGYKTMACIENTDAWDGAVPYVIGSPVSLPNTITMHVQGERVLRNAFPKILDNLDAGGSGDMYQGLNQEEQDMLRELTNMGFPPMAWYPEAKGQYNDGSLPVLTPVVKMTDPSYFQEFWTVPGYLGADPSSHAVRDRLQFHAKVTAVHTGNAAKQPEKAESRNGVDDAWKKMLSDGGGDWLELDSLPQGENLYLLGVNISFETGAAKGKQLLMGSMQYAPEGEGGAIGIGMCYGMDSVDQVLSLVKPGDEVFLDNSDYIAIQSYYRHQVPQDLSFHAWDQFRSEDGSPALPQRANVMGYGFTGTGTVQDGNIQTKVIMIQALMDESTCPWCADWYRKKVIESKGSEKDYRLYCMQRCMHGDVSWLANNMVVNYKGALLQALLDMADWIQLGKEPLKTTVYTMDGNQVVEEADPARRNGMQAGVQLTVNGEKCVRIKAGEEVTLRAEAVLPENSGEITSVYYDFKDNWTYTDSPLEVFPIEGQFDRTDKDGIKGAVSEITHRYEEPGTWFASVRVASQRNGDRGNIFTQIRNLDRVRIIVE